MANAIHRNRVSDVNGDEPSKAKAKEGKNVHLVIEPADLRIIQMKIAGTSPFMQCRFPEKAKAKMMAAQQGGTQARNRKNREPRDFDEDYKQAIHRMENGDAGIPAGAFRAAAISACRLVGFKMTIAKLSVFVEADGYDINDGTPLVKIFGKPEKNIMVGRNADGGADLRVRALWRQWHAVLRVRYDAKQMDANDVLNLIDRVGQQVGIGEGRADSRQSAGIGFGFFRVVANND